ncbi:MAG: replication protein P [Kistimonas sp.]|nr:replication protein P [Kistimonas sp.]
MKQGHSIASQQLHHLQTGTGMPAGQPIPADTGARGTPHHSAQPPPRQPDIYDAVNLAFMMMRDAFPQQFLKAWPTEEDRRRALALWARVLQDQNPRLVKKAIFQLIREERFLPSPASLRRRCQLLRRQPGLPSAQAAWQEACQARHQTASAPWSHPAVYLAARATGWFLLNTEPRAVSWPPFERNYSILCNRVAAGESLESSIPKALPDPQQQSVTTASQQLRQEMQAQGIDPDGGHAEFLKEMKEL